MSKSVVVIGGSGFAEKLSGKPIKVPTPHGLGADLVGMTAAIEAILAAEQGTPYAIVGIGTNWGAGLGGKLSHDEVVDMMGRRSEAVSTLLLAAIGEM
jgi:purine nucleoside phosphorylase